MDDQHARVRPNWAALSLVLAAGIVTGLLPFLLFLRVPYVAGPLLIYAMIAVALKGRKFVSQATEQPDLLEWLLAGWNGVGVGAATSVVGFTWYGLSYLTGWLFGLGANALGWTIEINPASIATYVSAFFAGMFALAVPFLAADEVPAKLYPGIAGTRSVFFPLTTKPWVVAALGLFGVVGSVAALGVFGLDPRGLAFTLSLTAFFVVTGGPLLQLGSAEQPSARMTEALMALNRVLSAAGYKLTANPTTGSPEVDPLIKGVDFLAVAKDRGYAIKIQLLRPRATDETWANAFEVRAGAKALQRALRAVDTPEIPIEPYLLVIGAQVSDAFRTFFREEGVKLLELPNIEAFGRALAPEATDAELRQIAQQLLEVPLAVPPITVDRVSTEGVAR